jgi:hypothetical protein
MQPIIVPNIDRVKNLGILKGSYEINGEYEVIITGMEINITLFKTASILIAKEYCK